MVWFSIHVGLSHLSSITGPVRRVLRRSNFNRGTWTRAATGDPDRGLPPVIAGMHFHDLRHTHKTWLIEDDIPEIAQAKRLGHQLPGIRGVYSHVTPPCSNASPTPSRPGGPAHRPRRLHAVDDPPRAA